MTTSSYDAILVVSFGGPEGIDDVIPFLENVLRGRNVPHERMLEVARRYEKFGGVSPINAENRKLIAALDNELQTHGLNLPIYFGNRNWHPLLAETVAQMRDDGIRHALAFVTSPYSSYSSCRQYLENIEMARALAGRDAPQIRKLRAYYNHPGFITANVEKVVAALRELLTDRRPSAQIAFTAHSIPLSMAQCCEYEQQLHETARLIAERVWAEVVSELPRNGNFSMPGNDASPRYRLVYQSRSGLPKQPWLEPDIGDYLKQSRSEGITDVVIAPIGFISDHMEVVYDLDIEAKELCRELGLNMVRASTVGTHPAFISMIREVIFEQIYPDNERKSVGAFGPADDQCAIDCCLAPES